MKYTLFFLIITRIHFRFKPPFLKYRLIWRINKHFSANARKSVTTRKNSTSDDNDITNND